MSQSVEVILVPEDDVSPRGQANCQEDGVEIPLDRIAPDTLSNLIAEFVTREWEELGDAHHSLADKIEQVRRQLQAGKARVVFDLSTNTCNIVPCEGESHV